MRLSINGQKIRDLIAIPFLFLFVYGFPITFLPINTSKVMLIFMVPIFLITLIDVSNKYIVKKWLLTKYAFLLCMIMISIYYPVVFHDTRDFAIAYKYFIMLIEALIGSLGFYYLFLKNRDLFFLCRSIVIITVLQSLIILSMLISPQVRETVFQLTVDRSDLFLRYGGFRGLGLSASVTYDLSVFLSIGMILSSYMVIAKRQNIFFYSFAWLINFVAIMITGRTGLIGVAISLWILVYAFKKISTLKKTVVFVLKIFLILIIGVVSLIIINPGYIVTLFNEYIISFAFEMFINHAETGQFETESSNILMAMYFPVSLSTFFIGDGYYMDPVTGRFYMGTDAGYMRHLLFYGIFPSLMLYFFYLSGFLGMAKKVRHDKIFYSVILLLGGYFFIVHIKGDFLLGSPMNIKIFFILFVYIFYSKKTNTCNKQNISS